MRPLRWPVTQSPHKKGKFGYKKKREKRPHEDTMRRLLATSQREGPEETKLADNSVPVSQHCKKKKQFCSFRPQADVFCHSSPSRQTRWEQLFLPASVDSVCRRWFEMYHYILHSSFSHLEYQKSGLRLPVMVIYG
jgi:hypothetical protein